MARGAAPRGRDAQARAAGTHRAATAPSHTHPPPPPHPYNSHTRPIQPLPSSAQVHSVLLRLLGAARSRVARLESAFGSLAATPPSHLAAATEAEEGAALRLLFSTDMVRLPP